MRNYVKLVAESLLHGATDNSVVVCPLVWDDGDSPYFILNTCGPKGWRCVRVSVSEESMRGEIITALAIASLFIEPPPFIIHDMDDELAAMRLCETLWPGERITYVRKAIEAERKAVMQ